MVMGKSEILLTIDRGNSRMKVSVFGPEGLISTRRADSPSATWLEECVVESGATAAAVCSVGAPMEASLMEVLGRIFGDNLLLLDHLTPLPIRIDYATPSTLGLDRIAAAVAASASVPQTDLLVVDAGTALTVDRVSADCRFLGGNISPGVSLRLRSLHQYTSQLPLVDSRGELPEFGHDTETAIRCGVVRGVVAEIKASLLPGTHVVISGGDAPLIAPLLGLGSGEVSIMEDAVGEGLNIIFRKLREMVADHSHAK